MRGFKYAGWNKTPDVSVSVELGLIERRPCDAWGPAQKSEVGGGRAASGNMHAYARDGVQLQAVRCDQSRGRTPSYACGPLVCMTQILRAPWRNAGEARVTCQRLPKPGVTCRNPSASLKRLRVFPKHSVGPYEVHGVDPGSTSGWVAEACKPLHPFVAALKCCCRCSNKKQGEDILEPRVGTSTGLIQFWPA
eukprot:362492-Chlamydomonas_euryale.AAC.1